MTRDEALLEAKRRWKSSAFVRFSTGGYQVGRRCKATGILIIEGQGETWEAAFADADRQAEESAKGSGR